MQELTQTNPSDKDPDVLRFEQMEDAYFDVESIESIFDFYAENSELEKAERVLQLGLKLHPNSIDLLIKKTFILIEKGEEKVAIPLLKRLLKFEEMDPELYFNLGWAYLKTDNPEKALSCFREAANIFFDEYDSFIIDIAFNLNELNYTKYAIELLEETILKYPNNENLLFELAYSYDNEDQILKTIDIYNRILNINPFSEATWFNLAIISHRYEDFNSALYCFDIVLSLNPNNAEAHFDKANLLLETEEPLKALNCYFEAVSHGFEPVICYHQIAFCLEQLGQIELALRFYDLSVKTHPTFLFPWFGYISLLISTNNAKKALEKSMEAILISDMYPEFMFLRAKAHILTKDYHKALSWLEKSIKHEPNNIRYIYKWLQVKNHLFSKKDSLSILDELRTNRASIYAINYVSAAISILELNDYFLAGLYLENALIEAPEDFDFFLDVFSFQLKDIFKSKILKKIVRKYVEFE